MLNAESITPYEDERGKGEQVREMFDSIAPVYDFMNRAMTMGVDRLWRRATVKEVARRSPRKVLDVATGTADLAIALARTAKADNVLGVDLSKGMVEIGRKKVEKAGLSDRVTLQVADCLALPLDDASVDCVTVAFGVRNFERLLDGYREIYRVLRPGGSLMVLELSTPQGKLAKACYDLYTKHLIPLAGRMVSHDRRAYSYLPASIAACPQRGEMTALMKQAGFSEASWRTFSFGACCLYVGEK
ncbi:MAG: bifunctional demethylmenaquinone methyltransferase/2-methoxy-6-polyprenyl-1,4-benzoquinol methylase UbiE [Bacteroidales bacterium]|nr:bifunctional demethylmenaquinone methyltransferase/2-methoxy-6-polyprenyl-1,4-benzoquinol methylase UbiE [Bacteroidales bacterium]MCD8394773.1 bifunctional demethylmenaquinone methyltransferase/2-methoxy-6-polyprenyl-1,4-benzoquinol methylase UbiE [Bacteroidales bacterium]